jgi:hypothetical protein
MKPGPKRRSSIDPSSTNTRTGPAEGADQDYSNFREQLGLFPAAIQTCAGTSLDKHDESLELRRRLGSTRKMLTDPDAPVPPA